MIADMLNYAMDQEELPPFVLLETMAGKGTEVGRTFEELAAIIDKVERKDRMGVCLDTCHVYDGGYDIAGDTDGVLAHFDEVIGLSRLKAIHLNDDKNPMGSHKDRHEKSAKGQSVSKGWKGSSIIRFSEIFPSTLKHRMIWKATSVKSRF